MQYFGTTLQAFEAVAVGCAWLAFALIFFVRKKPPRMLETVRDRRSLIGLILQILGFGVVRSGLRPAGAGFLALGPVAEGVATAVALALMAAALYITYRAVRTLGKQWSLTARLVDQHELITEGPYELVRHPIYTAMLGMLVATAIAVSQWQSLLIAIVVFLLGTMLRIRAEEQLLVAAFGDVYREYARRVPMLIPRWPGR